MDKMTDSRAVEAQAQGDRLAIKLLVAAGYVTEAKANEALNIAHGFDKGPLAPPSAPVGVEALVSALQSMRDRMMSTLPAKFGDGFDGDFDVLLEAINTLKRCRALAQQPAACDMGELCIGCEPRNADGSCPDQQPATVDGDVRELLDAMDSGADPRPAFLRLRQRFPARAAQPGGSDND